MDIRTTTRNVVLTPSEQRRLRALSGRMSRYFRNLLALNWSFSGTKDACTASCGVHSQSGYFRSRVKADRPGAAMDQAFDKVVRQRRRERVNAVTGRSRAGATRKRTLARTPLREIRQ